MYKGKAVDTGTRAIERLVGMRWDVAASRCRATPRKGLFSGCGGQPPRAGQQVSLVSASHPLPPETLTRGKYCSLFSHVGANE